MCSPSVLGSLGIPNVFRALRLTGINGKRATRPSGFDFEAWALERDNRPSGSVRDQGAHVNRHDFVESFGNRGDRVRLAIRERMNSALQNDPYRAVLVALAIGEESAIPGEQWRVFWRTGVGHLMSIPGLHITMVASLLYWL